MKKTFFRPNCEFKIQMYMSGVETFNWKYWKLCIFKRNEIIISAFFRINSFVFFRHEINKIIFSDDVFIIFWYVLDSPCRKSFFSHINAFTYVKWFGINHFSVLFDAGMLITNHVLLIKSWDRRKFVKMFLKNEAYK